MQPLPHPAIVLENTNDRGRVLEFRGYGHRIDINFRELFRRDFGLFGFAVEFTVTVVLLMLLLLVLLVGAMVGLVLLELLEVDLALLIFDFRGQIEIELVVGGVKTWADGAGEQKIGIHACGGQPNVPEAALVRAERIKGGIGAR